MPPSSMRLVPFCALLAIYDGARLQYPSFPPPGCHLLVLDDDPRSLAIGVVVSCAASLLRRVSGL